MNGMFYMIKNGSVWRALPHTIGGSASAPTSLKNIAKTARAGTLVNMPTF